MGPNCYSVVWLLLSALLARSMKVEKAMGFRVVPVNSVTEESIMWKLYPQDWTEEDKGFVDFCDLLVWTLEYNLPNSYKAFLSCVVEDKTEVTNPVMVLYFKAEKFGFTVPIPGCCRELGVEIENMLNGQLEGHHYTVTATPHIVNLEMIYYYATVGKLPNNDDPGELLNGVSWVRMKYTGWIRKWTARLLGQGTNMAVFHGITFKMFEWSIFRRVYYAYFYVCLRTMKETLTSEEKEKFEKQIDESLKSGNINEELVKMTSITRYAKMPEFDLEPSMKTCELLYLKNAAAFKVTFRENDQENDADMDMFLNKWTDSRAGSVGLCDAIPKALKSGVSTMYKAYLFCAPGQESPTYRIAHLYFNATNLGLSEGGHGCIYNLAQHIKEAINLGLEEELFTVKGDSALTKVEWLYQYGTLQVYGGISISHLLQEDSWQFTKITSWIRKKVTDTLRASNLGGKFLGVRPVLFYDGYSDYAYFLTYFSYDESPIELSELSDAAYYALKAESLSDGVAYLYSFSYDAEKPVHLYNSLVTSRCLMSTPRNVAGLMIEGLASKLAPHCSGVGSDLTGCLENLAALLVADKQFEPEALHVQLHTNVSNENLKLATGSLYFVRSSSGDEMTTLKSTLAGLYGNTIELKDTQYQCTILKTVAPKMAYYFEFGFVADNQNNSFAKEEHITTVLPGLETWTLNEAQSLLRAKKLKTCEITSDILKHFVVDQTLRIRGTIEFDYLCLREKTSRLISEGDKQLNFHVTPRECENFSTTFESKGFRKLMSGISCSSRREPETYALATYPGYLEETTVSEMTPAVSENTANAAFQVIMPKRLPLLTVLCLALLI